jgi:hypothetical protein
LVARAALLLTVHLFLVHDTVHDLKERWLGGLLARVGVALSVGLRDSILGVVSVARAALVAVVLVASWLLALELALWLLAVGWLDALVVAVWLFADRGTLWLWSLAGSVALSWVADGLALRATILFAGLLRATDRASWAFAVDSAGSARGFFALHFTLWTRADRVAHSRALWIITLPLAVWVALFSGDSRHEHEDKSNSKNTHFLES